MCGWEEWEYRLCIEYRLTLFEKIQMDKFFNSSSQAVSVNNYNFVFQYIFVSLLSRDSTYKLLKSVCGHLEVSMTSLSLNCCLSSVFLSLGVDLVFPFCKNNFFSIISEYRYWQWSQSIFSWKQFPGRPPFISASGELPTKWSKRKRK